jgi:murein DD-endopeptidase MepM/ murein hydrolase activator NlpD
MSNFYPIVCDWLNVCKRAFHACLNHITVVAVLAAVLGTGILFLFPPVVQAAVTVEGLPRPAYFEQLENYSAEIVRFREERLRREEALAKALLRYEVKRGDTLTKIAALFRTDIESIISWNEISNPHLIFPGQYLDILTIKGTLHKINKGDTIYSIAARYKADARSIAAFNLLDDPVQLKAGETLIIPGGVMPPEERKAVQATLLASRYGERNTPPAGSEATRPSFRWPVQGRITSRFGPRNGSFHYGLDIAVPLGSYVGAAAPGVVFGTGFQQGYGLVLMINHGGGWSTLYAHNSQLLVEDNDKVSAGQPVALVGASGNATGPHLHLEIIYNGRKLDPLLYLPR